MLSHNSFLFLLPYASDTWIRVTSEEGTGPREVEEVPIRAKSRRLGCKADFAALFV